MINTLININGTDYKTEEKITINKSISDYNSSSKFTAVFNNYGGKYSSTFNLNEDIIIKADKDTTPPTTEIFRGIIEDIQYSGQQNREMITLSGRDYSAILQDIICSPRVFKNTEASEIIKSLMRQNAQSTGVTYNNVDTSTTTITKITFNGVSLFDAIRQIAEFSGYYFFVDTDKDLNFKEKDAVDSGETFDNTNIIDASFTLTDDDIFNEVKVLGNRQQTFAEEVFTTGTDNTGSVYTVTSKPYNVSVSLSGASNTLYQPGGIINISDPATDNVKFLVDFNNKQVVLTSGTTAGENVVPAGSVIIVDYYRSTPLIKTLSDNTSIATYGLKKKEITDKNIADLSEATDIATTFITEHKDPKTEGNIKLQGIVNITPGETCTVNMPFQNQTSETYSMIQAIYNFSTQNNLAEQVLSLTVNKKVVNLIDLIKEHELRLRSLETAEVESSVTNVELFSGSMGVSGTCVVVQKPIGSVFYFGVTNHSILNSPSSLLGPIEGGSVIQTL